MQTVEIYLTGVFTMSSKNTTGIIAAALIASASLISPLTAVAGQKNAPTMQNGDVTAFPLTRPEVFDDTCAPNAKGFVRITSLGEAERMEILVKGMPANSEVDVFTIQVPNFPFGMSWYVGDIETDENGRGYASFISRFNEETFVVAPDIALAPVTHEGDALENPATAPVHTYHVGIWFNSPEDAASLGCSDAVTPFNGEHTAGIQVLNTGTFADDTGPLLNGIK